MEQRLSKSSLEAVVMFIDFHNLEGSLRNEGYQVDIVSLRDYLSEGRWLIDAFVYAGLNPNNPAGDEKFHRFLRINGFLVRAKPAKVRPDGSLKCDLDTELILDVVDFVERAKPSIVLIVSGDGDFTRLAQWLRLRGIRVEIASTTNSVSQDLREAAHGYIDLCGAIEEIQRAGDETPAHREEVIVNGSGDHQRSAGPDPGHVI